MGLNVNQQYILDQLKMILPDSFISMGQYESPDIDSRLLAYAELILNDINVWPPLTNYTTEDMPIYWRGIIILGANTFTMLFEAQRWSLLDFDYSEGGLTLRLDRVMKLTNVYDKMLDLYKQQVKSVKRIQTLKVRGKGLGTPRYQSQIGQFLKIALGSAFTWNSP